MLQLLLEVKFPAQLKKIQRERAVRHRLVQPPLVLTSGNGVSEKLSGNGVP